MADLRDRLRRSDPALHARPLDEPEQAAIRRAMREAVAERRPRAWRVAAGVALAAASIVAAFLLLSWPKVEAPPDPEIALTIPPAPFLPPPDLTAPPVVARAHPRRAVAPREPEPPAPSTTRELRFVTASGTQILWTFRTSEEGA